MGRLAMVAVAAVVLVTPAAAELEGALLAVSASGGELVMLSADGDVTARLLGDRRLVVVDATWSPDGRRIAFTSPRSDGVGREVYVVDADGSGLRTVTSDSDQDHYNTRPLWVSATEVVYHRRDDRAGRWELRVVDVDTGTVRMLGDADANLPLRLQPGGSLLIYTLPGRRALVDIHTGEQHDLPSGIGAGAAWSQDGTMIAYGNSSGLHVIRADGTDVRTLFRGRSVREVAWAPDDRLLFTVIEAQGSSGKFGTPTLSEIYTVGVDGTGLRKLTGMEGDVPGREGLGANTPDWWPGGSRVFFRAQRTTNDQGIENWVMNVDGSCETPWAPQVRSWAAPQWRPGASGLGRIECSSAILRLRLEKYEIGLRDVLPLTVVVRNDGTRPLRDLRVTLSTTRGTLHPPADCDGLVCRLGSLAPGNVATLSIEASSRNAGAMRITASATYDGGPDTFQADNHALAGADVLPCDIVGTWGADRLDGTARRDHICGRPGDDRIEAGAGNDVVDAGSGRDTVIAGRGRDTIRGGGGSDVILARDRERDIVDCGTEPDTVIADRIDVTRGCERVLRR